MRILQTLKLSNVKKANILTHCMPCDNFFQNSEYRVKKMNSKEIRFFSAGKSDSLHTAIFCPVAQPKIIKFYLAKNPSDFNK